MKTTKLKTLLNNVLIEEIQAMVSNPDFVDYQFVQEAGSLLSKNASVSTISKFLSSQNKLRRNLYFFEQDELIDDDYTPEMLIFKLAKLAALITTFWKEYETNLKANNLQTSYDDYGYDAIIDRTIFAMAEKSIMKDLKSLEENKLPLIDRFKPLTNNLFEIFFSWKKNLSLNEKIDLAYDIEAFLFKTMEETLEDENLDLPISQLETGNDYLVFLNDREIDFYYLLLLWEVLSNYQEQENQVVFRRPKPLFFERENILMMSGQK